MTAYYNAMVNVKCELKGSERAAFILIVRIKFTNANLQNQSFLMKQKDIEQTETNAHPDSYEPDNKSTSIKKIMAW